VSGVTARDEELSNGQHRHRRELTYRRHNSASRDALSDCHIARSAGSWIAKIGLSDANRCLCAIGCHGDRHYLHLDTNHQCKNDNPTQKVCERRFAHMMNMDQCTLMRKGANDDHDEPTFVRLQLA